MNELPIWGWPLLFLAGMVAGLVDAMAGGGGLITVPALLSVGLPPSLALGTNKLQSCFGSASAAWHYGRAGMVDIRDCIRGIFWTALGSVCGALAIGFVSDAILRRLIPSLLMATAVFVLVRPGLGKVDAKERLHQSLFYAISGFGLGAYDGFFGPGVGSFWALSFVLGLGFNLRKATAHTKVMNFTSNFVALVVLALTSRVVLFPGLVMGTGQVVGARLGAALVIKRGARLIRPVLLCVILAITIRLMLETHQ